MCIRDSYPTPYFFSARVFGQIDLVSIELQTVYRQTDPVFVGVLDHIRNNTAGAADLQLLNTRYGSPVSYTHLDVYKRQLLITYIELNQNLTHFANQEQK